MNRSDESVSLARALWAWEELGLELGETALISGEGPMARMVALAASCRGACPVVLVGSAAQGLPGAEELAGRAGVAAVDLTGRSETVDALLEALPHGARLMLAGHESEPQTIDYYNNIHRKGVHLLCRRLQTRSPSEFWMERAVLLLPDLHERS
jgi:threonine dehydrogenase-like Zn-dependent dehydrogenase